MAAICYLVDEKSACPPSSKEPTHVSTMITEAAQLQRATGWDRKLARSPQESDRLRNYIAFQMASAGLSTPDEANNSDSMASFSTGILNSLREKNRLLSEHRAPIDSRIETFLREYFAFRGGAVLWRSVSDACWEATSRCRRGAWAERFGYFGGATRSWRVE